MKVIFLVALLMATAFARDTTFFSAFRDTSLGWGANYESCKARLPFYIAAYRNFYHSLFFDLSSSIDLANHVLA